MPFYEYQCSSCGHHREELQKVSERPLRKCPHCGRSTLKRLVSAPVFRLKGGGWYETDFKGAEDTKRNIAGDKEPAAGKPKEEKPAAAPAAKAGDAAKPAAAADKATPAGPKPAPTRKTATRRRVRK